MLKLRTRSVDKNADGEQRLRVYCTSRTPNKHSSEERQMGPSAVELLYLSQMVHSSDREKSRNQDT